MAITRLRVCNFKSFGDFDIQLAGFNVFVGANASGKSNFMELFRFLNHVREHDLEQAIALQGGVEYFRNMKLGATRNFELELASDRQFKFSTTKLEPDRTVRWIGLSVHETKYRLDVAFTPGERKDLGLRRILLNSQENSTNWKIGVVKN